jgi:hypothetical protein
VILKIFITFIAVGLLSSISLADERGAWFEERWRMIERARDEPNSQAIDDLGRIVRGWVGICEVPHQRL